MIAPPPWIKMDYTDDISEQTPNLDSRFLGE